MNDEPAVLTERRDGVLLITLNRPDARNAVNSALAQGPALTGDPVDAERAYELGIVNRLAEPGGAVEAALELADAIVKNGPLALRASKRIVLESRDWPQADWWQKQGEIAGPVMASEDARE